MAYRLIEADSYKDKDMLVVGGGDSAIEAALALSKAARNRVTLSYRGESFDRARERNRKMLLEAERQGRVQIEVFAGRRDPARIGRARRSAGRTELPNQYVFILIGGESPEAFLRKIGIEIVEKVSEQDAHVTFA